MKKLSILAASLLLANTAFASDAELRKEVEMLKAQLNAVASQLENADQKSAGKLSKLTIGGYGEHHLNIVKDGNDTMDAHRFVLYTGYQFNDKVSFQSELEVEHAIAGEGQKGEVELEQAFINYKATPNTDIKIGQFLVPVGLINENHEPDTFYGVERPAFTKRIIPTTWWEAGVMVSGKLGENAAYNAALHSGLNTDDGAGGLKAIRSGRQKNAKAKANDLAATLGVSFAPVAGANVGATVNYQSDITQGAQKAVSAVLTEVHGTLNQGNFGLKGVYAQWDVDTNDSAYESQKGFYIEPSYKVMPSLGVFARYSDLEYAKGLGKQAEEQYTTVGANYWLADNVVLKADYEIKEVEGKKDDEKSLNLGVGWSF